MRPATIALFATALIVISAHAAGPNMKEGMWEITTKMDMPGSNVAMPQQTVKHCMTKKDIEDPKRTTPAGGDQSRCKMTDYKLQGNTATWAVVCEGQGSGTGSITYSGDSYTGTQTMNMKTGGQAMNMKMDFSGRRVGDCPKQ